MKKINAEQQKAPPLNKDDGDRREYNRGIGGRGIRAERRISTHTHTYGRHPRVRLTSPSGFVFTALLPCEVGLADEETSGNTSAPLEEKKEEHTSALAVFASGRDLRGANRIYRAYPTAVGLTYAYAPDSLVPVERWPLGSTLQSSQEFGARRRETGREKES